MISKNTFRLAAWTRSWIARWIAGSILATSLAHAQPTAGSAGQPGAKSAPAPSAPAGTKSSGPGSSSGTAAGAAKSAPPIVPMGSEAAIRAVLERQQFDWNRGDTDGFLIGYAPDAVFVSDAITRGLEQLRVRYQSHYPTRASMGTLTFSDIEVHMIDASNAYVLGHFRLQRDSEGGGDTQGVYSLLFKKTVKGWKIVLDHTS
jgi:ketosteroid isomerase-like protein